MPTLLRFERIGEGKWEWEWQKRGELRDEIDIESYGVGIGGMIS